MFRTLYNRTRISTCPGSPTKKTYKMRIDKFGKKYLAEDGEDNLYQYIQSFHDSTEVHKLIEKYQMIGDPSVFQGAKTSYGDFTDMPTTLAEVYSRVTEANEFFKELPVELKREFNHSPSEFYSSIGTEKYYNVLARLNDDSQKVEVTTNEQE